MNLRLGLDEIFKIPLLLENSLICLSSPVELVVSCFQLSLTGRNVRLAQLVEVLTLLLECLL